MNDTIKTLLSLNPISVAYNLYRIAKERETAERIYVAYGEHWKSQMNNSWTMHIEYNTDTTYFTKPMDES